MGESKIASPPPQMVATSGGAAPDPSLQEVQVVAPQNFAGGPLESPSEHVSFSASCHGGAPECLRVRILLLLLCVGRSPQVLFLLLFLFPQPFVQEAKRLVQERLALEANLRQLQGTYLAFSASLIYLGSVL